VSAWQSLRLSKSTLKPATALGREKEMKKQFIFQFKSARKKDTLSSNRPICTLDKFFVTPAEMALVFFSPHAFAFSRHDAPEA
jgi:hypothetical protein